MNREELISHVEQFSNKKVLVIGDVMIDAYYWGHVNRISPEAPVPVVDIHKSENRMGGAANVALNLKTLGAEPIICAVLGNDEKGDRFMDLMEERGFSSSGIVKSDQRPTTTKTRIISAGQHMLRIDEENKSEIDAELEAELQSRINEIIDTVHPDAIVFEDYNKGVLTDSLIRNSIKKANEHHIPTVVDPKKDNFFSYKNCTLFKPNLKELREGTKLDIYNADRGQLLKAVEYLTDQLQHKISLVTLSEYGVLIKSSAEEHMIPAFQRKIMDVSGAGDTVISVAALCLATGMDLRSLATISNMAGGLVCEHVGVVPIEREDLLKEIKHQFKD